MCNASVQEKAYRKSVLEQSQRWRQKEYAWTVEMQSCSRGLRRKTRQVVNLISAMSYPLSAWGSGGNSTLASHTSQEQGDVDGHRCHSGWGGRNLPNKALLFRAMVDSLKTPLVRLLEGACKIITSNGDSFLHLLSCPIILLPAIHKLK